MESVRASEVKESVRMYFSGIASSSVSQREKLSQWVHKPWPVPA